VWAVPGLDAGQPFLITTSGREIRRFNLQDDGRFNRLPGFHDNPFQVTLDMIMVVNVFTVPQ
jgi:hypothetical protein